MALGVSERCRSDETFWNVEEALRRSSGDEIYHHKIRCTIFEGA
jgi:hypothetical protein